MVNERVRKILAIYGLQEDTETLSLGGGTAGASIRLRRRSGDFLLRRRSGEQVDPEQISYEHRLLIHLKEAGLPVYPPLSAADGRTWVALDDLVYEVYPWVDGEQYQGNQDQLSQLAATMARFHVSCRDYPAKPNQQMEDQPERLRRELFEFTSGQDRQAYPALLEGLMSMLDEIEQHLNHVHKLPQSVVHGDLHPGNVKFRGNEVAGLFDFDWANRRERVRDVADGILFFCYAGDDLPDSSDIWSLTEFRAISPGKASGFLESYNAVTTIDRAEYETLPWIMAARLGQMRIRGMRKVPSCDRIRFLDRGSVVETIMSFARQMAG